MIGELRKLLREEELKEDEKKHEVEKGKTWRDEEERPAFRKEHQKEEISLKLR